MTEPFPDLTVIVVTRDREEALVRCLRSLASTLPGSVNEIIVADDGSKDRKAVSLAMQLSFRDFPIATCVLRHDTPTGPSKARNLAARHASSPLLWFVDDDVEVNRNTPAILKCAASVYPESVLGGGVRIKCLVAPPRVCTDCSIDYPLLVTEDRLCGPGEIWACNLVIPAQIFWRHGGFSSEAVIYGEEYELLKRIVGSGGILRQVANAAVDHVRSSKDLELTHLLYRRWLRGRNQARNAAHFDWDFPSRVEHISFAVSKIGHAIVTRCTGGILDSMASLGRAFGPFTR